MKIWTIWLDDSTEIAGAPRSSRSSPEPTPPAHPESVLVAAAEASPHKVQTLPYEFSGGFEPVVEEGEQPRRRKRPTLSVSLYGTSDRPESAAIATVRAIVDSGADYAMFSAEWARLLGIDLDTDCVKDFPVLAAPPNKDATVVHHMYAGGLLVEILGEQILLPTVIFCEGLPQSFLGRRDFFVDHLVAFDERNERLFVERLPRLMENDEDDDDERDVALAAT